MAKEIVKGRHIYRRWKINKASNNTYLERLSPEVWIQRNHLYGLFWFFIFFIVLWPLASLFSNLIPAFIANDLDVDKWANNNFQWSWIFIPKDIFTNVWGWSLMLGAIVLATGFTLLAQMRFFRLYWRWKRTNWVDSEKSGTAHWLTDERNPWTQHKQLEQKFYPYTYFLTEGQWVVRARRTDDYIGFWQEFSKYLKFKELKGMSYAQLQPRIAAPVDSKGVPVQYPSANDVARDILTWTKGLISDDAVSFGQKFINFLRSRQLRPILIQHPNYGKVVNAVVVGASGSGKTTKTNYVNIITNANAIKQPSMLISDPKGELYTKLSGYLTARGYEVFSLDLFDLIRSMSWNPFQEIYSKVLAKGLLKQFFKQYRESEMFFKVRLNGDNVEWVDENDKMINPMIETPYLLWTKEEYDSVKARHDALNITSMDEFVFDDRHITNYFYHESDRVKIRFVNQGDPLLNKYVCSVHTYSKASESCCNEKVNKRFIFFDGLVFKTLFNLQRHFETTLATQISEAIDVVQQAIFTSDSGISSDHWVTSAGRVFTGAVNVMASLVEDNIDSLPLSQFNMSAVVNLTGDSTNFTEAKVFKEYRELEKIINATERSGGLANMTSESERYNYLMLRFRYNELKNRPQLVQLSSYFKTGDNERGSINSVFTTKFFPFTGKGIKVLTSSNDITFDKLIDQSKPKVIFIGINVNEKLYHPFITLFISNLHQKLSEQAKKMGGSLDRTFLFMLDEFGNIPAIPRLGEITSTCRSENMKFMLIVQALEQIKTRYDKAMNTILTNCDFNVYIKANEKDTAETYSRMLGTTTITDVQTSLNGIGKTFDLTDKVSYQQRSLMTADEIFNLDATYWHDTIFISQSKPMLVMVEPWYKVWNTKQFSYHIISFKPNDYSELKNIPDMDWILTQLNSGYVKDYYKITGQSNAEIAEKTVEALDQKIEFDIMQKMEQLDKMREEFAFDFEFSDLLIKEYNLTFSDPEGLSEKEFKNMLTESFTFIDQSMLFQSWPILVNKTSFQFDRNAFYRHINDFNSHHSKTNVISEESAYNYQYTYQNKMINGVIISLAKLLFEDKNLDMQVYIDKYPNIAEPLLTTMKLLETILYFELWRQVDDTEDNYTLKLYEFLANYKNYDNNDISELNQFYKSLVSICDNAIVSNTRQYLTTTLPTWAPTMRYMDVAVVNRWLKMLYHEKMKAILSHGFWNNEFNKMLETYENRYLQIVNSE